MGLEGTGDTGYYLHPKVDLCQHLFMKSYTDGHIQTIESMYVLWRMMGVPKWHERRWSILESIERMPRWSMGMRAWIKWIWSLRI